MISAIIPLQDWQLWGFVIFVIRVKTKLPLLLKVETHSRWQCFESGLAPEEKGASLNICGQERHCHLAKILVLCAGSPLGNYMTWLLTIFSAVKDKRSPPPQVTWVLSLFLCNECCCGCVQEHAGCLCGCKGVRSVKVMCLTCMLPTQNGHRPLSPVNKQRFFPDIISHDQSLCATVNCWAGAEGLLGVWDWFLLCFLAELLIISYIIILYVGNCCMIAVIYSQLLIFHVICAQYHSNPPRIRLYNRKRLSSVR